MSKFYVEDEDSKCALVSIGAFVIFSLVISLFSTTGGKCDPTDKNITTKCTEKHYANRQ